MILEILVGIALGYLIVSMAEAFLHKNIHHASLNTRKLWKKYPKLFQPFIEAYFSHHTIHHCKTYKKNYISQFESMDEKTKLDAELIQLGNLGKSVINNEYGITLRGWSVITYVFPVVPLFILILIFLPPTVFIGSLMPFIIYPMMSKYIHYKVLHRSLEENQKFPSWFRWLLKTKYMRMVAINHFTHHKYFSCNYNLLIGGDYIFGYYQKPSEEDLKEMEELHLFVE